MKKIHFFFSMFFLLSFAFVVSVQAQLFRKGSILLKLSEGTTHSYYGTANDNIPNGHIYSEHMKGVRDPIALEYGITNHWGLGLSSGTDLFNINPNLFYKTGELPVSLQAQTSEFTLDLSYHFFVTQKNDLSLTGSFGSSSVSISGENDGNKYQYTANGNIVRFGVHEYYYFYKRLGALAMLSTYSSNYAPQNVQGNTFGNTCSTAIKGYALEFGFCFRIRH